MPVSSMARPINPPSASISRTRCPFAVPPIAGLHGICATVASDSVQSPTLRPMRAAAHAASTPAWPAPMTITSKSRLLMLITLPYKLLSNTESREDLMQHIIGCPRARHRFEHAPRVVQIGEHEFLGSAAVRRRSSTHQRIARMGQQVDVTDIGDRRRVAE